MSLRNGNVRYVNVHRCVNCKEELTSDEVYTDGGRCPLCGFKGPKSGAFVVETLEEAREYRVLPPMPPTHGWWNLWGWLPW